VFGLRICISVYAIWCHQEQINDRRFVYFSLSIFSSESSTSAFLLRTIRIFLKVSAFARVGELRKRGYIVLIEPPSERRKVEKKINLSLETRKKLRIFLSFYTGKVTYASRPRIAVAGCSLVDERFFFFQKTCTDEYLIKMIWYARWKNKLFIVLFFYFSLYEYRYIRTQVLRY